MTYSTRPAAAQKDLGVLTPQEKQLIEAFRRLDKLQQSDILKIARAFAAATR